MTALEPLGKKDGFGRALFFLGVPNFDSLPGGLTGDARFAALVVADASGATAQELRGFGAKLLSAGAVYVCAWGTDCRSVEDAVDQEAVEEELRRGVEIPVVMTTSHVNETLDEAIEFFLKSAFPDEAYADACKTAVAIIVGNPEGAADVKSRIEMLT